VGSSNAQIKLVQKYGSEDAIPQVKVAVIDTGVYLKHELLAGRLTTGKDFVDNDNDPSDENGHGTHCAGIVANNTAKNVQIMPLRAGTAGGTFAESAVYSAIEYAISNGAKVISMCFGGSYASSVFWCETYSWEYKAIRDAEENGVLMIAAHGNEAHDTSLVYPSSDDAVISVSALNSDLSLANYSNYGSPIDLCAPGTDIISSSKDGGYVYKSGTSMATPSVAACAALIFSENTSYSSDAVRYILENNAKDLGSEGWDKYFGYGCVYVDGDVISDEDRVARINGNYYSSLEAALDAAVDGDTITLLEDVSLDKTLVIDKSVRIQASKSQSITNVDGFGGSLLEVKANVTLGTDPEIGKSLLVSSMLSSSAPVIAVDEGAQLDILGSATVEGNVSSDDVGVISNAGTLTISNAIVDNIYGDDSDDNTETSMPCTVASSGLIILDGKTAVSDAVLLKGSAQLQFAADYDASSVAIAIKVDQPKNGAVVASCGQASVGDYLPVYEVQDGWTCAKSGNDIVLKQQCDYDAKINNKTYTDLQDAFIAANDGDVVTICRDIVIDTPVVAYKNFTINSDGDNTIDIICSPRSEGLLYIALANIVIEGGDSGSLTIDGANTPMENALIYINSDGGLELGDNVSVVRGVAQSSIYSASSIVNFGSLTIDGAQIRDNSSSVYGGAIYNGEGATLTMSSGEITNNSAFCAGGGIYNEGTCEISGGTISNNVCPLANSDYEDLYIVAPSTTATTSEVESVTESEVVAVAEAADSTTDEATSEAFTLVSGGTVGQITVDQGATVELKGSPVVTEPIIVSDEGSVNVVGKLSLKSAIPLATGDFDEGFKFVLYADELKPSTTDFKAVNMASTELATTTSDSLEVSGQYLVVKRVELKASAGWTAFGTCEYQIVNNVMTVRPIANLESGTFSEYVWKSYPSLVGVVFEDGVKAVSANSMFENCNNLQYVDLSKLDISDCTSFEGMFAGCSALTSVDFGDMDTSHVTNMSRMFYQCSALGSVDFSGFDTSNVQDMSHAFYACNALNEIVLGSGWNFIVKDDADTILPDGVWYGASGNELTLKELVRGWDSKTMAGTYVKTAPENAQHHLQAETVTYNWSFNGESASATASVTCSYDGAVVSETQPATAQKTDATCAKAGSITYTATFTNSLFDPATTTKEVAALGHSYGKPTYEWLNGYESCKADASCTRCGDAQTETVKSVVTEVAATEKSAGSITYTATFTNGVFATQTHTETIPALNKDDQGTVPVAADSEPVRLDGNKGKYSTRYDTMEQIDDEGFSSSTYAIVASGEDFPDALASASLAGCYNCPIILTQKNVLSTQAKEELTKLGVKKVYLMGGPSAVSDNVLGTIEGMGISVERVNGEVRQDTSLAAANRVLQLRGSIDTVIVASGYSFADALSIGPWAYKSKTPILLTAGDGKLTPNELTFIKSNGVKNVIIVGGPKAVSYDVEKQVSGLSVQRLCEKTTGGTRYTTSQVVAEWSINHGMSLDSVYITSGKNFPDALAGSALAGSTGGVIVLADPGQTSCLDWVINNGGGSEGVYILGGESAVPESIYEMAKKML
jgi:surface protein